jgi:hypothetical protein
MNAFRRPARTSFPRCATLLAHPAARRSMQRTAPRLWPRRQRRATFECPATLGAAAQPYRQLRPWPCNSLALVPLSADEEIHLAPNRDDVAHRLLRPHERLTSARLTPARMLAHSATVRISCVGPLSAYHSKVAELLTGCRQLSAYRAFCGQCKLCRLSTLALF